MADPISHDPAPSGDPNGAGPGPGPFVLSISTTRADLRTVWVSAFDDPGAASRLRQYRMFAINSLATSAALLGPAVAGCAALLGVSDRGGLVLAALMGYLIGAAYIAYCARQTAIKTAWARQIDQSLRRGDYDTYTGPSELQFDSTGVSQVREGISTVWMAWSEITGIEHNDEHVTARGGWTFAFSIPRRALPEGMTTADAAARIRAIHEASGAGEMRRLRARLAATDTPCPSCRYNLRGCSSLNCPECGRRIRVEDLDPAPAIT